MIKKTLLLSYFSDYFHDLKWTYLPTPKYRVISQAKFCQIFWLGILYISPGRPDNLSEISSCDMNHVSVTQFMSCYPSRHELIWPSRRNVKYAFFVWILKPNAQKRHTGVHASNSIITWYLQYFWETDSLDPSVSFRHETQTSTWGLFEL